MEENGAAVKPCPLCDVDSLSFPEGAAHAAFALGVACAMANAKLVRNTPETAMAVTETMCGAHRTLYVLAMVRASQVGQ